MEADACADGITSPDASGRKAGPTTVGLANARVLVSRELGSMESSIVSDVSVVARLGARGTVGHDRAAVTVIGSTESDALSHAVVRSAGEFGVGGAVDRDGTRVAGGARLCLGVLLKKGREVDGVTCAGNRDGDRRALLLITSSSGCPRVLALFADTGDLAFVCIGALAGQGRAEGVDDQVFGLGEVKDNRRSLVVSHGDLLRRARDGLALRVDCVAGWTVEVVHEGSSSEAVDVACDEFGLLFLETFIALHFADLASLMAFNCFGIKTAVLASDFRVVGNCGHGANLRFGKVETDLLDLFTHIFERRGFGKKRWVVELDIAAGLQQSLAIFKVGEQDAVVGPGLRSLLSEGDLCGRGR